MSYFVVISRFFPRAIFLQIVSIPLVLLVVTYRVQINCMFSQWFLSWLNIFVYVYAYESTA